MWVVEEARCYAVGGRAQRGIGASWDLPGDQGGGDGRKWQMGREKNVDMDILRVKRSRDRRAKMIGEKRWEVQVEVKSVLGGVKWAAQ